MFKTWKDDNGNWNRVDLGDNHFINGKCVNPLSDRLNSNVSIEDMGNIGDTYK